MKNKITKKSTIRDIMQVLGTDLLRQGFNNNIHVAATIGSIKENKKVIITDTRFLNEFEAVKSREGICIKIERDKPCHVCGTTKNERKGRSCEKMGCPSEQPLHESETALDKQTFDYVIYNNGSIKELVEIAKKFLKDYKIKK